MKKTIELLAPARTAEIGIEAVRHGADAVYIGPSSFGARSAAANTMDDIAHLCDFAHQYGAKVYATMNTLLYDNELREAEALSWKAYEAGVDALIVQDMAMLRMTLPPIALHASTQCDIRTPERAKMLVDAGFTQLVVARELSLTQIRRIADAVSVPIEAFVHGALCVSYSGQCYASEYAFGRSANRGCCAQFCRLPFDLIDADGQRLVVQKHLLSLRDMNRSAHIADMIAAGVTSFKIEGRLKPAAYVKNITAYYRQCIDEVLAAPTIQEAYRRSSYGKSTLTFEPRPEKSFNRGFTEYMLHGDKTQLHDFDSPKARGEAVGRVVAVKPHSLLCSQPLNSGDGICFVDSKGSMEGFRVNRAEGREIFPARMPAVRPGDALFRNHDQAFEMLLARPSAERKMGLSLRLEETAEGYRLSATDEAGRTAELDKTATHETAKTPQAGNRLLQFGKLGNTPYELKTWVDDTDERRFIPSSWLSSWRREIVDLLLRQKVIDGPLQHAANHCAKRQPICAEQLDYRSNVANEEAAAFYRACGAKQIAPAYELQPPRSAVLMTCAHCIRRALGMCLKQTHSASGNTAAVWKEPLSLQLSDGRKFPLAFDCRRCEMIVYSPAHE